MNWYYVENNRRAGPISEENLLALIKEGTVRLDTLVWRDGMEQWKPLGDVGKADPSSNDLVLAALTAAQGTLGGAQGTLAGAQDSGGQGWGGQDWLDLGAGQPMGGQAQQSAIPMAAIPLMGVAGNQASCAQCGRMFATNDMVPFGAHWVCADCKPLFFQRIREGVVPVGSLNYAGFWIRFLARFLDNIILGVFSLVSNVVFAFAMGVSRGEVDSPRLGLLFTLQMLVGYGVPALYEMFFLGRFGATPGKMVCGLRVVRPTGEQITYLRALGRHFATFLSAIILLIGYIMAAFDSEKRALHDRICDTRVVRKG